jgi:DNA-binding ferritin-like protein
MTDDTLGEFNAAFDEWAENQEQHNLPPPGKWSELIEQAVATFADIMKMTEVEAMQNHEREIFQMVCAYVAQSSPGTPASPTLH